RRPRPPRRGVPRVDAARAPRVIRDAPLSGGLPVLAGLSITCQLDQIPTPASLPVGPTLTGVAAKGRFGKTKNADDGTTLHQLAGQKRAGAAGAAESGKLTITPRKKGFAVQFTQAGLDLCAFPAGAALRIQIGSTAASAPIVVHPRGKHQCP